MRMTFDGEPLLLPTRQTRPWLDATASAQAAALGLPDVGAGTLAWPLTASRPASLMAVVPAAVAATLWQRTGVTGGQLVMPGWSYRLWPLPPISLTTGTWDGPAEGGPAGLALLPLTDVRYRLRRIAWRGCHAHQTRTWAALVDALSEAGGVSVAFDLPPAALGRPDGLHFWRGGGTVAERLDEVAAALARRVVADAVGGLRMAEVAAEQVRHHANLSRPAAFAVRQTETLSSPAPTTATATVRPMTERIVLTDAAAVPLTLTSGPDGPDSGEANAHGSAWTLATTRPVTATPGPPGTAIPESGLKSDEADAARAYLDAWRTRMRAWNAIRHRVVMPGEAAWNPSGFDGTLTVGVLPVGLTEAWTPDEAEFGPVPGSRDGFSGWGPFPDGTEAIPVGLTSTFADASPPDGPLPVWGSVGPLLDRMQLGLTQTVIHGGEHGPVAVRSDPATAAEDETWIVVTAHLDWMHRGASIPAGTEVLIRFFETARRWVVFHPLGPPPWSPAG